MTRVALGRHRNELTACGALVTGVAIDSSVRSGQGESIVVLLNLLNRDLPSANGMALFAVRSQLTPVNIGVAILASLPDIAEDRLDVALCATHRCVHAAKRIFCLVVVEFRDGANRLPCARGVTVLAWDIQVSVRTVRRRRSLRPQVS